MVKQHFPNEEILIMANIFVRIDQICTQIFNGVVKNILFIG